MNLLRMISTSIVMFFLCVLPLQAEETDTAASPETQEEVSDTAAESGDTNSVSSGNPASNDGKKQKEVVPTSTGKASPSSKTGAKPPKSSELQSSAGTGTIMLAFFFGFVAGAATTFFALKHIIPARKEEETVPEPKTPNTEQEKKEKTPQQKPKTQPKTKDSSTTPSPSKDHDATKKRKNPNIEPKKKKSIQLTSSDNPDTEVSFSDDQNESFEEVTDSQVFSKRDPQRVSRRKKDLGVPAVDPQVAARNEKIEALNKMFAKSRHIWSSYQDVLPESEVSFMKVNIQHLSSVLEGFKQVTDDNLSDWFDARFLPHLDALARWYSLLAKSIIIEGKDDRKQKAYAQLYHLLYTEYDEFCAKNQWFHIEKINVFQSKFQSRDHEGVDSINIWDLNDNEKLIGVIVEIRKVGLWNLSKIQRIRKARVVVGA